jgi:hypothetical protein
MTRRIAAQCAARLGANWVAIECDNTLVPRGTSRAPDGPARCDDERAVITRAATSLDDRATLP